MSPTFCRFLLPVTLLAALAGCSPDQPVATGRLAASPAAPAAPQPAAAPAATRPGAVASPAAARPPLPVATAPPASSSGPVAAARPQQWVRRPLAGPQPARRLAVGSNSSAQVVTPGSVGEPQSGNPAPRAAATPAAPADSDLAAFCAQAAPQQQAFWVRPGRDTVLLGQRGTRLVVPAHAFDVPTSSGPVRLEVREFYSTADIILAGLGTRADTSLLETGGMLHLYAAANGQTVHLRPGMQLLIQLPTQQQLPGMRLYEGVSADASHAPSWRQAGTDMLHFTASGDPDTWWRGLIAQYPPKNPRWPYFEKDKNLVLKEFDRLMPDSKASPTQPYRPSGKEKRQQLQGLSHLHHKTIRQAVVLAVVVDSTGQLQKSTVVEGDSVLAAEVLATVRQLPAQRPASFVSRLPHHGRTTSAAEGQFLVLYTRSGKRLVGFNWVVMDKYIGEFLGSGTRYSLYSRDSLYSQESRSGRTKFARQFSSNTPLTLDGGLYYELAAGSLGWINCDRLLDPGPRIRFAVEAPDSATVVSLVFKGQRSILASSHTEGRRAVFEQVPDGAAATVVALRRENGITYLATSGLSLRSDAQPALQFHPVSLDELRTELARL